MASSSKKKTTMAKMNREAAVRDKRLRKQAKKDARKLAALEPQPVETDETAETGGRRRGARRRGPLRLRCALGVVRGDAPRKRRATEEDYVGGRRKATLAAALTGMWRWSSCRRGPMPRRSTTAAAATTTGAPRAT